MLTLDMLIHPTAVIHPEAKIDPTTVIGPYSVIDQSVEVGPNCVLGPQVHITGDTQIGANNRFHTGSVIGDAPQDLKYGYEATRLVVGDENVFREHVTVHRSNNQGEATVVGSGNYFMAGSHVGHNSRIGNRAVLANGAALGGHVEVGDRAFISANCLVHQFVRIGELSLMQGGAAVSKDVPPYVIATGVNGICGLNVVGLRRAGITAAERLELKQLYRTLFCHRGNAQAVLKEARQDCQNEPSRVLLDFIETADRGICTHGRE